MPYRLITVKVIALEKVSFSDIQIRKTVFNTLIAHNKQYLLNRDNLTKPIQMGLSQKQKTFSKLFVAILKSILNFKHIPKKDDPHS